MGTSRSTLEMQVGNRIIQRGTLSINAEVAARQKKKDFLLNFQRFKAHVSYSGICLCDSNAVFSGTGVCETQVPVSEPDLPSHGPQ